MPMLGQLWLLLNNGLYPPREDALVVCKIILEMGNLDSLFLSLSHNTRTLGPPSGTDEQMYDREKEGLLYSLCN